MATRAVATGSASRAAGTLPRGDSFGTRLLHFARLP